VRELFLIAVAWLMLPISTQAASFDCAKASTRIEEMICSNSMISSLDDDLELAYLRALERSDNRSQVSSSLQQWLMDVRNPCPDAKCLLEAYVSQIEILNAISGRKCYWLEPSHKRDGKWQEFEPVCRVLEENLNQFCDQPPMACELRIAPQFKDKIIFPNWEPVNEVTLAMVEEFLMAPYGDSYPKDKAAIWNEERPKMEAAFKENRLVLSKADIDLYNLGRVHTAYRLDYGNCQTRNPQLADRKQWHVPVHHAEVRTEYVPEVQRDIKSKYFVVTNPPLEIFLYDEEVYDVAMHGYKTRTGKTGSSLAINRHERWTNPVSNKVSIHTSNICEFNYQPVSGVEK